MNRDCSKTDGIEPALIRQELQCILESPHFRNSKRSKQFLQFVVEQKITGNEELLKERLIGVEVFGRDIDYATGDDPIVRVQAGEVRRRLGQYRSDTEGPRQVSIELPLGSYAPVFHQCNAEVPPSDAPGREAVREQEPDTEEPSAEIVPAPVSNPPFPQPLVLPQIPAHSNPRKRFRRFAVGLCAGITLVAAGIGYGIWNAKAPAAWMNAFWGPALAARKPALICMGNPALYQPSLKLYENYAGKHPGSFATPMERRTRVLPLAPEEVIHWGDMEPVPNSGPAMGGVRAAINISALFGRLDVPFGTRFGNEASFADLRESPAVIVGALNNRWMMQMSSDLHFTMQEAGGLLFIHEAGTGRIWQSHNIPAGSRDYGLVTRQLKGPTGQFTVKIEGIGDSGTQAGSEIISDPENLRNALQSVPKGWARKNIQLLVSTDVTDGKPGPPKLVDYYVW